MYYISWFLGVGLAALFAVAWGVGFELKSGKDTSSQQ